MTLATLEETGACTSAYPLHITPKAAALYASAAFACYVALKPKLLILEPQ